MNTAERIQEIVELIVNTLSSGDKVIIKETGFSGTSDVYWLKKKDYDTIRVMCNKLYLDLGYTPRKDRIGTSMIFIGELVFLFADAFALFGIETSGDLFIKYNGKEVQLC